MPNLLALMAFRRSTKLFTSFQSFVLLLIQPVLRTTPLVNSSVSFYNHSHWMSSHWRTALFAEGYEFVSFDVESLFTNAPLQRTLKIIIDRIYNKKLVKTKLKKSTLRKLIRDTCTKTVFSCNNKLYEQTDGVSMGGSLGPVLANIIMTEFEHETINNLINKGLIAFYCRYVDDTLLLIKRNTINTILEHFHKFDRNIRFTFDLFENSTPHFLDINIASDGLGIYRKYTFTGQYTNLTALYLGDTKSLGSEHWLTAYTVSVLLTKLKLSSSWLGSFYHGMVFLNVLPTY